MKATKRRHRADLIITQNITLDGVIANDSSWSGPAAQDDDFADVNEALMAQARAFLVGRMTFDELRGYWPQQLDDATGVTDHLNRVAKYVVSATLEDRSPVTHLQSARATGKGAVRLSEYVVAAYRLMRITPFATRTVAAMRHRPKRS